MNPDRALERDNLMARRLVQVARTYLQIAFWIQAPLLVATLFVIRCFTPQSMPGRLFYSTMTVYQVGFGCLAIIGHLKTQMNHWRSRLTPGFRLPHLAVAATALAVLLAAVPRLLAEPLGLSALGMTALCMIMSVGLAWMTYSPTVGMAMGVAIIVFIHRYGFESIERLAHGTEPAWAAAITLAGAMAFALLLLCFSRLDGNHLVYLGQPHDIHLRTRMTRNPNGRAPGPLERLCDRWIEWSGGVPRPGIRLQGAWSRIQHRRFLGLQGFGPWMVGAAFVLIVALAMLIGNLIGGLFSAPGDALGGAAILLLGAMSWPPMVASISLPGRWPALGGELLLPASRRDFVRETGLALGMDFLTMWASSLLTAILVCVLWWPHLVFEMANLIAVALALAASSLVFSCGVLVWLTRLRHGIISGVAMIVATLAASAPFMEPFAKFPAINMAHAMAWIVGLCGIGAALILDAYRRWRRTELD